MTPNLIEGRPSVYAFHTCMCVHYVQIVCCVNNMNACMHAYTQIHRQTLGHNIHVTTFRTI